MNADDLPRCEYDPLKRKLKLWNCANRDDETYAAKRRIEQITTQLDCPHGLTNGERSTLAKERNFWQRQYFPAVAKENPNAAKKLKAAGRKLSWVAKKADQGALPAKRKGRP